MDTNHTSREDAADFELGADELDAVAGGDITTETEIGYDVGYVITAAAAHTVDFVKGVWDGIMD